MPSDPTPAVEALRAELEELIASALWNLDRGVRLDALDNQPYAVHVFANLICSVLANPDPTVVAALVEMWGRAEVARQMVEAGVFVRTEYVSGFLVDSGRRAVVRPPQSLYVEGDTDGR